MQLEGGDLVTDPKEINDAFANFYKLVYKSVCTLSPSNIEQFLNDIVTQA